jgi:hypothetical protein
MEVNKKISIISKLRKKGYFTFSKKKVAKIKPTKKKNPLTYNATILIPEVLLGVNGSLRKCIDYIDAKLQEYITTNDVMVKYFGMPLAPKKSLYKKERILSDGYLKEILNSTLYREDIDTKTNDLKGGDSKDKETKGGLKGRRVKKTAARRILYDNGIPSDCDICSESEILPAIVNYKPLGEILDAAGLDEIPTSLYIHPYNIGQLCPNCFQLKNYFESDKFTQNKLPKYLMDRIKKWYKKYGPHQPHAIKANLNLSSGYKGYDGVMIYNQRNPGKSCILSVKQLNEDKIKNEGWFE